MSNVTAPTFPGAPAQIILEPSFINHPSDAGTPTWEWTSILAKTNEYDAHLIDLSGLVLRPTIVCFWWAVVEWKRVRFSEVIHHD
jgi:hypothetical protein